jgi:predicted DCC family thiol-disulfide oxidoreductase YuxK
MRREAYSYRNDASVPAFADDKPVIVFDGECIFCSGWVRFLLRHDRRAQYRYLTAQSPLARLGLPWSLANICRILPAALRDPLYDLVARNRYRIAGRRQSCMVPTPEERGRFIA